MRIRRADRIAIDAASADFGSPAFLGCVIEPQHEWPRRDKGGQQHTKQDETGMTTTPDGAVQNPVIILKLTLVAQTHHTQSTGDGSLTGSENGPDQKNICTAPDTLAKQWTKRKDDERQLRWHSGHGTLYKLSVLYICSLSCMSDFGPSTE